MRHDAAHHDHCFFGVGRAHVCAHSGLNGGFTFPGAEKHYPPDVELEPVHTEIRLAIDLDGQSAGGTVCHTVRARRQGPRELVLNGIALEDLEAHDPDGRGTTMTYDGTELSVVWADAFVAQEERRLTISYRLERPAGGLYFSKPTEAYPDEPWYAATDHETERARGDVASGGVESTRQVDAEAPLDVRAGCAFRSRCSWVSRQCHVQVPRLESKANAPADHLVACPHSPPSPSNARG